jgi:hypothetical protein
MKKLLVLMILTVAAPVWSLEALGGSAAYLRSGAGARALGMGGAAVALVDDVTATVWNPAGLTRMGVYGTQIGSMVSFLSQDRSLNYLALGQHFEGVGDFGVTLQHFAVDKIEGFDNNGFSTGFFSDQEVAVGFTYANLLGYQFRYGFTGRGLYHGLAEAKAYGYGADLGFQYQPNLSSDFMVGANLQNPIAALTWEGGRQDPVTPVLKLGISDKYMNQRFDFAADLDVPLSGDGAMSGHAGAELWLVEGLAARVGLNRRDVTAGGTWRYEFYQFDYAYVMSGLQLGDAHQLSLILRF